MTRVLNSQRCTTCRTCCSSRPWRFLWHVQTSGFEVRQSLSRHGNSWNIWRACLCCAASGETLERKHTHTKPNGHQASLRGKKKKKSTSEFMFTYLQIRQLRKSFFTSRMGTFIRPIPCVDSETRKMNQQVRREAGSLQMFAIYLVLNEFKWLLKLQGRLHSNE